MTSHSHSPSRSRCRLVEAPTGPWRQRRVVQHPYGGTRRGPRRRRRDRRLAEAAECRPWEGGEREHGRLPPQDLRGRDRRHRHRLDLDVGARLISVDLQEHVADAQRRALAMGDDDLDLLHVGHYRGEENDRVDHGLLSPDHAVRMARTARIDDGADPVRVARSIDLVEMGESRTPRPRPFAGDHYERVRWFVVDRPDGHRHVCRAVQSRAPRSGLTPDYATLVRIAASLSDASTTREAEVASTLTLLPKQRGRESTGGCQVLRFAA